MSTAAERSDSRRTLLERFLRSEAARQSREEPIEARKPGDPIPLAPSQQQIFLHSRMAPDTALYNETVMLQYRGLLDRDALSRAVQELLNRHEIWRTTFASIDGQVAQAVHREMAIPIPFTDLTHVPQALREEQASSLAAVDALRPFDLGVGPLVRLRLLKVDEDCHRLCITVHHIIFDWLSISRVVLRELPAIYAAYAQHRPCPLPAPRYQYADYAVWEKRLLNNDVAAHQMEYWRATLGGEVPALELPADHTRPAVPSYAGKLESFGFGPELTASLKGIAQAHGVTLYMLLLASFKALLFRYSGQGDLLIGGTTDGRRRPEFEHLMGCFLHTVVLRTRPQEELTFREYLAQVKDVVLGAHAASDIPFDQLVRNLQPKRDSSRHPFFQVMFALEPPASSIDPRWDVTHLDLPDGFSKFDLYVALDETAEGLTGRFLYSSDLFEPARMRRMARHWTTMLEAIVRDQETTLASLPLLDEAETRLLLQDRNETARAVPQTTIHELFEDQAARTPQAVAVEDGVRSLTYRELNQCANRLAGRLREAGAGPETLIGLMVSRTCDMLVTTLAILKSGAAYLPLDPGFPEERLNLLMEDSQIALLVTERALASRAPSGLRIVWCEDGEGSNENLGHSSGPENVAYVLYTSGSTGRPKGVEIPHSAVVNFLLSMRREPGFTAGDTLLAVTTLSFDIAALEIYLPLICGGRVIIASPEDARDPIHLMSLIDGVGPSVLQATPAMWRALIEAGWKGNPQLKILCGGEAMTRDLAEQMLARCGELWNMYGPTETTIWSTIQRVTTGSGPIPIGRPIDNTQVYVLDKQLRLAPEGITGELYIGGAGVARRYLHRPELTAERFVEAPALNPGRIYRTGDLARWLTDGTLECLGRSDHQIKIRGFRIEPEEIEAAILKHPGISGAAVKAWADASQNQSLTAYITGTASPGQVRAVLEKELPQYMIPTRWVTMEALPLTPNGKIDRKQLRPPDPESGLGEYVAPSGDFERRVAGIWESVLGRKSIGAGDNFFDLGGHSLLVARLLRRVEGEFGTRLSMAALFQAPTIQQFAAMLKDSGARIQKPLAVPLQPKGSRTPLLWLYAGPVFRPLAARLGEDRPFLGIGPDDDEYAKLSDNFPLEELAEGLAAKIRTLQPQGPYNLAGWCDEGVVAYEVASQLRRQGCDVEILILLDAVNPEYYRQISRGKVQASSLLFHLRRVAALRPGDLGRFLRRHKDSMADRVKRARAAEASAEMRVSRSALKYTPPRYEGRTIAIMPSDYPSYRDPGMNWSDRATGEFEVKTVAGNHVTMLEEPWVADLASCVQDCLEQAEAASRQRRAASAARRAAG